MALDEYISVACRPLVALPVTELANLSDHVVRYAIDGTNARWRIALALDDFTSGEPQRFLRLVEHMDEWLPDLRKQARVIFRSDSIGCLEMGLRIHLRTLRHLIAIRKHLRHVQGEFPEQIGLYYELLHSGMCLDLCVTTVLWYLDGNPSVQTAIIPEELCFLVKEYSLINSAVARLVFPANSRVRQNIPSIEKETAVSSVTDRQWDREFCDLALPDLQVHILRVI
jgi:hypothetical protein